MCSTVVDRLTRSTNAACRVQADDLWSRSVRQGAGQTACRTSPPYTSGCSGWSASPRRLNSWNLGSASCSLCSAWLGTSTAMTYLATSGRSSVPNAAREIRALMKAPVYSEQKVSATRCERAPFHGVSTSRRRACGWAAIGPDLVEQGIVIGLLVVPDPEGGKYGRLFVEDRGLGAWSVTMRRPPPQQLPSGPWVAHAPRWPVCQREGCNIPPGRGGC